MTFPSGRFWSKVEKTDTCWNWTAYKLKGYGRFSYEGRPEYANRISYMLAHGSIPDGMYILHTCGNPACVRPEHLYAGTQRDNARDRIKDGHQMSHANGYDYWAKGEASPRSKLNANDVRAIRSLWATGRVSKMDLVRQFGVSHYCIRCVLNGKTWGSIPLAP